MQQKKFQLTTAHPQYLLIIQSLRSLSIFHYSLCATFNNLKPFLVKLFTSLCIQTKFPNYHGHSKNTYSSSRKSNSAISSSGVAFLNNKPSSCWTVSSEFSTSNKPIKLSLSPLYVVSQALTICVMHDSLTASEQPLLKFYYFACKLLKRQTKCVFKTTHIAIS